METPAIVDKWARQVGGAVKREVQTTLGRRYHRHIASSSHGQQQQARPPNGSAGLVVHSAEDDGWDVIERLDSMPRRHTVMVAFACVFNGGS